MTADDVAKTFKEIAECDITKWEVQDQLYLALVCSECASKLKPLVYKYHAEGTHNDLLDALRKAYEEEHK